MNRRIFAFLTAFTAVVCLGSCTDVDEPESAAKMIADTDNSQISTSDEEITSVEETVSAEEDTLLTDGEVFYSDIEMIPTGLWWAVNEHVPTLDGEAREDSYYQINSSGNGTVTYQSSGQSVAFRTKLNGDHIDLYFEGQDVAAPLYINKVDETTLEVSFNSRNTETWTNMGQMTYEDFHVMNNAQLSDMAKESFNSQDGAACRYTESHIDDAGNVVIELYDTVEDKNLLDTYTVARFNGMGTDKNGKPVYLAPKE